MGSMDDRSIFEPQFVAGRWSGLLHRDRAQSGTPEIGVFLGGRDLGDVALSADENDRWKLDFAIPAEELADGVSTFVFVDRRTSEPLGRFCIIAGGIAEQDVLAQLDALQSEMDHLKAAFRREARRNRTDG